MFGIYILKPGRDFLKNEIVTRMFVLDDSNSVLRYCKFLMFCEIEVSFRLQNRFRVIFYYKSIIAKRVLNRSFHIKTTPLC